MKLKLFVLLTVLVIITEVFVGCGQSGDNTVIGMVADTGGLGDQSFNDSAWSGLERAEKDFDIERKVLESSTTDDYLPNLTTFAEEDVALIIGVGFRFVDAIGKVAEDFPDKKFAIIDSVVDAPNVASLTFAEHEGSFLVGVIAGLKTETNKIGFIGGMKVPLIEKFEYGFRAGVKTVNPNAKVFVSYAGSFNDAEKGKTIATVQHQAGADVIFHSAGGVGIGLFQVAAEHGFWAIGVDQDQSALAPSNVLCSMVKRVDKSVYALTKEVVEGTFVGMAHNFNLANQGVGYSDNAGNLTYDLKAEADKYQKAIAEGVFAVPQTEAEFNAFVAPSL